MSLFNKESADGTIKKSSGLAALIVVLIYVFTIISLEYIFPIDDLLFIIYKITKHQDEDIKSTLLGREANFQVRTFTHGPLHFLRVFLCSGDQVSTGRFLGVPTDLRGKHPQRSIQPADARR